MKPFWNDRKLETFRLLIGHYNNSELAEHFGVTKEFIEYSANHFNIHRTKEQARRVMGTDQKGKNNNNWRGGIASNNYAYRKIQKERYPDRIKAENQVREAKRSGKIKPEPCHFCGTEENIQAHIADYDNPLESIIWCCRKCNVKHHHVPKNRLRRILRNETKR